jgi:hypothetical protein
MLCLSSDLVHVYQVHVHQVHVHQNVSGGCVYCGTALPKIARKYICADFVTGRIWSLSKSGGDVLNALEIDTDQNIFSFGEDAADELQVLDLNGKVSRLVVK